MLILNQFAFQANGDDIAAACKQYEGFCHALAPGDFSAINVEVLAASRLPEHFSTYASGGCLAFTWEHADLITSPGRAERCATMILNDAEILSCVEDEAKQAGRRFATGSELEAAFGASVLHEMVHMILAPEHPPQVAPPLANYFASTFRAQAEQGAKYLKAVLPSPGFNTVRIS